MDIFEKERAKRNTNEKTIAKAKGEIDGDPYVLELKHQDFPDHFSWFINLRKEKSIIGECEGFLWGFFAKREFKRLCKKYNFKKVKV